MSIATDELELALLEAEEAQQRERERPRVRKQESVPPEFFTVSEAAAIFKVSQTTVRNWEASGVLKSVRLGGAIRFSRAAIESLAK